MNDIEVTSDTTLSFNGKTYRCAIGTNGFADAATRREGSLTTPIGRFALRECWYRPDRVLPPQTVLPRHALQRDDVWCDDATHPLYNRHLKLPFTAPHERLWREDNMYDVIVPLGFNDDPVVPGKGSAIFLHVAKPGYSTTEGCVAVALEDLLEILKGIAADSHIDIKPR